MNNSFNVEGIISINCFKEDNQLDINVAISPQNKFLYLIEEMVDSKIEQGLTEEYLKDDILESFSLLFTLNSNSEKKLDKSLLSFTQLEVFSSYIEDYEEIFKSVVSQEEIDSVRKYVFSFLTERNNNSKLWESYLS